MIVRVPIFILMLSFMSESVLGSLEKEAPTEGNTPDYLGLELDQVTWDDIRLRAEKKAAPSWSGSSLAFQSLGLAAPGNDYPHGRDFPISVSEWNSLHFGHPPLSLADQILELVDSVELGHTGSVEGSAQLSTAQKWDLLLGPSLPDEGVMTMIRTGREKFKNQVVSKAKGILDETRGIREEWMAIQREFEILYQQLEEARQGNDEEAVARIENQIKQRGERYSELSTQLKDATVPFLGVIKSYHRDTPELARRLSVNYPLTSDAWLSYSTNLIRHHSLESWGWYGHCHGAALASIKEKPVVHGVLVKKNQRSLLFEKHDLENLMVKAWSRQAHGRRFFAGKRCYHRLKDSENGQEQRIPDGLFCSTSRSRSRSRSLSQPTLCRPEESGRRMRITSKSSENRHLYFHWDEEDGAHPESIKAILDQKLGRDRFKVRLMRGDELVDSGVVLLTTACRDVNPMTLTLAMTHLIHEGTNLVVDGSQGVSVWNYSLTGYKMTFPVVPLKDGTMSEENQPIPATKVEDPYRRYRAPGTHYLLQVQLEARTGITYGDHSFNTTMVYTLEFDKNQRLIGGEWGSLQKNDPTNPGAYVHSMPIDFIWFYDREAKLGPGLVDPGLLRQLYTCGQRQQADGTILIKDQTGETVREVSFNHCDLEEI